jgi:hypothetical protein
VSEAGEIDHGVCERLAHFNPRESIIVREHGFLLCPQTHHGLVVVVEITCRFRRVGNQEEISDTDQNRHRPFDYVEPSPAF